MKRIFWCGVCQRSFAYKTGRQRKNLEASHRHGKQDALFKRIPGSFEGGKR
jgi:hypothetical protein